MSTRRSTTGGQYTFAQIPNTSIQRSSFNRSCGLKTTFDAGFLIPIFVDEALPGDTFNLRASLFGRFATPIKPIMDNVYLDTFYFAIPYRLVWDNWQKFNGEQDNPGDSTDFMIPVMTSPTAGDAGYEVGSIHDHMGIPPQIPGLEHSALWHRAYNLVWNEWFRSQDLQDSLQVPKDDGPDDPAIYELKRRGKRHDYFTSCLPAPQKGPAVEIGVGGVAPLTITGDGNFVTIDAGSAINSNLQASSSAGNVFSFTAPTANSNITWNTPGLTGTADLSNATAVTINALREAFQVQRMFERDQRGGTRYTEVIRAHFGVTSPDQRLQRPEYLGGGSMPVSITPVPQTTSTDATTPQGNLAAYGTATGRQSGFTKSFTEHCLILGLACVRADLNYQQGVERMFSRRTRFEFFWPTLAHLGEQTVLQKEIAALGTSGPAGADDIVFGYQERYAEYRYKPSRTAGLFRSTAPTSLDIWHLAQDYASPPILDSDFIEEDPPIDRVIAVDTEPHMIMDAFFDYRCARPMPTYSVPGMVDHF